MTRRASAPEREVRALRPEDAPAMLHLSAVSFGGSAADELDEDDRRRVLALLPYTRGVELDGKLAAVCRMYPFQMFLAGARVRCGALAGVVSSPFARRRGLVRAMLHDGLARLAKEGVGWCLEYPFDPAFYGRFGFRSVPTGRLLRIPPSMLLQGPPPGGTRLEPGADGAPLQAIHAAFARRFSFALSRDDGVRDAWGKTVLRMYEDRPHHRYLLEDAYLLFHQETATSATGGRSQRLVVRDLAYASPEGRDALLAFLGGFTGQVSEVELHLPEDDPLVLDRGGRYHASQPTMQARVAELASALRPFVSAARGEAVVALRDAFCAWNDGTFQVAWGPEGTVVERSHATPAASLSIDALPPLLTGAMSAASAVAVGLADGDLGALESLASLNAARPAYASAIDYF